MANNPWEQVGNAATSGYDEGVNSSVNIQRLKMEKQKMAQEAIKAKFEMMQKNYEHAWQVVKDPQLPGAMKVQYWNNIIAPYDNNVMGMKTPPMTKWNDELQSHVEQAAHVIDQVAHGELSVKEGKLAYNHIQAEVASNPGSAAAFKGIDQTLSELSGGAPIAVNVGNKSVQAAKNINGGYDTIKVDGRSASAPSQISVEADKNRHDEFNAAVGKFQEAAKIVSESKSSNWDKLPIFASLTPEERDQAVREAHSTLYLIGGQLGLKAKDVSGVINGDLTSNKVLSDVGKNFALPGAHIDTSGDVPVAKALPGVTITPKVPAPSQSSLPAAPDAPQVASAPAQPPVPDQTQVADASAQDPNQPKDVANV